MKRMIIPVAALMIAFSASGQKVKESDVPAAVKDAFAKQFTSAKNVKWSKEGEGEFEAEFRSDKGKQSANFDKDGKWLITETKISEKWLPPAVQATIKKEFADYEVEEAEQAETTDQGSFFEIEFEQKEKTIIAQISFDGKVLKKEEEKENEKD